MNVIETLLKMRTDILDLKKQLEVAIRVERRRMDKRWDNDKEKDERAQKKVRQAAQ